MSKAVKFLSAFLSIVIITAAWGMYTTVSLRLELEQERLLTSAREFINNKIYDKGIAMFREALKAGTGDNANILYELANVYKEAESLQQYRGILQELINDATAPAEMELADIYVEAAEYDLSANGRVTELLNLLKDGIKKTDAMRLIEMYEENRYVTTERGELYEEAGIITGGVGLVSRDGLWGYVNGDGRSMLKPAYDLATNFREHAVVQKDNELFIIDENGRRQAVAVFTAADIARFDGVTFSMKLEGSNDYVLANWQGGENIYIAIGEKSYKSVDWTLDIIMDEVSAYQFIGLSSDSIRALKKDNKWTLIDRSDRKEHISPDNFYEAVAIDELGRCAVNGAVFVRENGKYYLMDYTGKKAEASFDDAKPFFENGGLAAVKRGDKWGFINALGDVKIDFIYDDAGSSALNLAPVKLGDLWGYINTEDQYIGSIVIEPQYYGAKQFVNGCAPVKSEGGWYYIMLMEYE